MVQKKDSYRDARAKVIKEKIEKSTPDVEVTEHKQSRVANFYCFQADDKSTFILVKDDEDVK